MWSGSGTTAQLHRLPAGQTLGFRVCAVDEAGHISDGTTARAFVPAELDPPEITALILDAGAVVTYDNDVQRSIVASDATGIHKMCVATDGVECPVYAAYTETSTVRLPAVEATHTVSVWLEDTHGFRTPTPANATITLELLDDLDADGFHELEDCDDTDRNVFPGATERCNGVVDDCNGYQDDGVLGVCSTCPAVDCSEVLLSDPAAPSGDYVLWQGLTACDMDTDGGGWTHLVDNLYIAANTYNLEGLITTNGLRWSGLWVEHVGDGSRLEAGGVFPDDLPHSHPLAFHFVDSLAWQADPSAPTSLCTYDFWWDIWKDDSRYAPPTFSYSTTGITLARQETDAPIWIEAAETASSCSFEDNSGGATIDLWIRRDAGPAVSHAETNPPSITNLVVGDERGVTNDRYVDVQISAHDDTLVRRSCTSDSSAACTSWQPYTGVDTAQLPLEEGRHPIYVWVEDVWGNRSVRETHVTLDILEDIDRDGYNEEVDCDDNDRHAGPYGQDCPAESCAAVLAADPTAPCGQYMGEHGAMHCEMDSYDGGWTRVAEAAPLALDSHDTARFNTEG